MRKLHLEDKVWKYRVGKKNVVIRDPDNMKYVVDFPTLKGSNWEEIERGLRKRYLHIFPSEIKEYIASNLI